jgi:hypothetical protein
MITSLINRIHLKSREMVWLEVTPPATITRTPEATEQLFSVIHGAYSARSLKEKLLKRSPVMSFEITSTKEGGIRYLIQVEVLRAEMLRKAVAAYIPDAKVSEVNALTLHSDRMLEFKQRSHYAFPLSYMSAFDQYDPLSYVISGMTNLDDNEQITMQLILSPVKLREASILARKILSHEDLLSTVGTGYLFLLQRVGYLITSVMWAAVDLMAEMYHGPTTVTHNKQTSSQDRKSQIQIANRQRPSRILSSFERELMELMHNKLVQPLFRVNLRVLTTGPNADGNIRIVRSALEGYSIPLYQSLEARLRLPIIHKHRHKLADRRLPAQSLRGSLVLSGSEIASLYHFPSSRFSQTDNLITSLSKTLPAPVSLKSGRKLSVLLGENRHRGVVTSIGLTEAERERHVYIIGGTGNGKTTLLLYSIVQDIQNGNGLAVIDPHGDLSETILRYIPEDRIDDVIYMNPDDLSYPIGMNLLELPEGLEGDDLLREKDVLTESVISVMRKLFSEDDSGGHRVEYVLRNAIQTALTLEHPTLFTVYDLLNNPRYRRSVLQNLEDENLVNFWKNEIGKAGGYQQVKMVAGITAKIGRFLFSASAKRILEQERSTIDFDAILDGRILICNFSKGTLGEDTSALFGTTVLAKLQLASLRRARMAIDNRRPFYLYVDEFQNFATIGFVQMLSEARKYRLFLTMAEQSTSQQEQQRLVDIILANVGTIVSFRSGSSIDERRILPLFSPYVEPGEIANLPAYSFYVRIAAVNSQEPMSGVTVLLNFNGNTTIAETVVNRSRVRYAIKFEGTASCDTPKANDTSLVKVTRRKEGGQRSGTGSQSTESSAFN